MWFSPRQENCIDVIDKIYRHCHHITISWPIWYFAGMLGLGLALRPKNGSLGLGSPDLGLDTKALALPISRPN